MLRSHSLTSLRSFRRYRAYVLVNVAGLTASTTCCILATLYVLHELSYDRDFENADRVYRVTALRNAKQSGLLASFLSDNLPEVENWARITAPFHPHISYGEIGFYQPVNMADQSLFEIFEMPVVAGLLGTSKMQIGFTESLL